MPCNANSKALWHSLTAQVFLSISSIMWTRSISTTIARHSNGLTVGVRQTTPAHPNAPHEQAAAIQHAVRQYWTKGIETSIVIRLRAKVD
tara:strand:+ start:61 stop:330 length:270 start_codon:yes stop_codon:yes gene_type:complete